MDTSEAYDHMAPKLTGKKEGTFAFLTVRDRWPLIVTRLVDQLKRNREGLIAELGECAASDVDGILAKFSELRYRMMTDKPLDMLTDRGQDTEEWNEFLSENRSGDMIQVYDTHRETLTWFNGPWLFVECYLYRLIHGAFASTYKLEDMDYFEEIKRANFNDHLDQIEEAATFVLKVCAKDTPAHELFGITTFLKMSLWGNRADMSLTGGDPSCLEMSSMKASTKLDDYVLINDINQLTVKVLAPLLQKRDTDTNRRIDIVLDNAGVELSGDLVLAEFLIARGFADRIVVHGKSFPWFVSDVTKRDFDWTLNSFEKAGSESKKLGEILKKRVEDGTLVFKCHKFWTYPHAYYKMAEVAPDLYSELQTSSLAIFKGDLNYRKLVGDRDWDLEATFEKACRGFAPCPFFALRTLKAETVAGLSKEVIDEIITKFDDDLSWMTSGEYAVCQLGGI